MIDLDGLSEQKVNDMWLKMNEDMAMAKLAMASSEPLRAIPYLRSTSRLLQDMSVIVGALADDLERE